MRARIVGRGRAGTSLARALEGAGAGWEVQLLGRDEVARGEATGEGVDLLVLAVPDGAVAELAAAVPPGPSVVAHLSGALGLDVLSAHPRRAVLHPLVSLPDGEVGAARLRSGAWFGLAAGGDPLAAAVVEALGGRSITVAEGDWATYHAAAVVASNHLVGLLGQVERLAKGIGVPLAAYLDLARGSLANVAELGAADALTGPVRRGDRATVERHLAALPADERELYEAGVRFCERLLPGQG